MTSEFSQRFYGYVMAYKQSESYKQSRIREYDRKFEELSANIFNGFLYTLFSMFFAIFSAKFECPNFELCYLIIMCCAFFWMLYNIYDCIKLCCRGKY
jgi:hypothetical protein